MSHLFFICFVCSHTNRFYLVFLLAKTKSSCLSFFPGGHWTKCHSSKCQDTFQPSYLKNAALCNCTLNYLEAAICFLKYTLMHVSAMFLLFIFIGIIISFLCTVHVEICTQMVNESNIYSDYHD